MNCIASASSSTSVYVCSGSSMYVSFLAQHWIDRDGMLATISLSKVSTCAAARYIYSWQSQSDVQSCLGP